MGPTENDQQAAPGTGMPSDGGAMPPAQPMPPAGGGDQGAGGAWSPTPPAGTDPGMGGAAAPNPEEVGMGDENPDAASEAPAAPSEPAAPAPDATPPSDPNAGTPGAAPQQ